MSKHAALKAATSLTDLAQLLGLPASALAYTLYKIPAAQKYTTFTIPKKNGGVRQIAAPAARLKSVQEYLANLLVQCRLEIEAANPRNLVSHGFRKEGSILTNASRHRSRRYVLNLDIEGFFPALNFGRVRGFFIHSRDFRLHEKVATVIAQIACHDNLLPQGSPCSPIISDLIGHLLDMRLVRLVKAHKCSYSRYVDDLTISTNQKVFPVALAYQLEEASSAWILGDDLLYEIHQAGFAVNHQKTRMQYRNSRQLVTGLTVNTKVNIRADYYRSARSMCHALFSTGSFTHPGGTAPATGRIDSLEGIANHIYFVKQHEARRRNPENRPQNVAASKVVQRHGIERLYSRLLFYKKFVALSKPLVLAEGRTDAVYLRAAIKQLAAYHGILSVTQNGQNTLGISFFRHSLITRTLLGIDGGSGHFPNFMNAYAARVGEFKHVPLEHPVIILIDNDDGANGVFGILKNMNTNISHTTTADFYPVARNLYVVKTPEIGPKSQIEDLFDQSALSLKLGGKTFNKLNDNDTDTEYGKAYFADHVIAPKADKINFAGFANLLDRIVATIDYHKTLVAAGAV